jgi:Trypsin-like peptidase domain
MDADKIARAMLRVGGGRGFVVRRRTYIGHEEPIIITAAHCLPHLPPPHPARNLEEETYQMLLAPLGGKPTVWATCLFVDPIADIAALGQPDNQALSDEADAYDQLLDGMETLVIADAPAQGSETLTFGDTQVEHPTAGEGAARVLSLTGEWLEGRVQRRFSWLAFEPESYFVGGMSGSPIMDANGAAIGVVSFDRLSPVIVDSLSTWLVRAIAAAALHP